MYRLVYRLVVLNTKPQIGGYEYLATSWWLEILGCSLEVTNTMLQFWGLELLAYKLVVTNTRVGSHYPHHRRFDNGCTDDRTDKII